MSTEQNPRIEMLRAGGRQLRVAVWKAREASSHRPILFFNGIGANIELMAPLADWFPDRDLVTFEHIDRRTPVAAATPELLDELVAARRAVAAPS